MLECESDGGDVCVWCRVLVESKADVDKAATDRGFTPLYTAAQLGQEATVRYGQCEITTLICMITNV